ncbi:MAG: hypothetical protein AAFS07_18955, partial [Pseudomonadota bacterium]
LASYHGAQHDLQSPEGRPHQGYGAADYDEFGAGNGAIRLARRRRFDAAWNCTPGFWLRRVGTGAGGASAPQQQQQQQQQQYTDPEHDPAGVQRAVPPGHLEDVYFPGTCEADLICNDPRAGEAEACPEGFVCDEATGLDTARDYPCRAGFVCAFGTSPDPDLAAPAGQFQRLCPAGFQCPEGTGATQAEASPCPAGYFCPTGTGEAALGLVASDAVARGLSPEQANPFLDVSHVRHLGDDTVRVLSAHDDECLRGADPANARRYRQVPVAGGNRTTAAAVRRVATDAARRCGRDHKWRLVQDAVDRWECDCLGQTLLTMVVHRFWRCTTPVLDFSQAAWWAADGGLDNLGAGSPLPGAALEGRQSVRDFWFRRGHLIKEGIDASGVAGTAADPACVLPPGPELFNATHGTIDLARFPPAWHRHLPGRPTTALPNATQSTVLHAGLTVQLTAATQRTFANYAQLKAAVRRAFAGAVSRLRSGAAATLDPFVYDLFQAVQRVEEHGEELPKLVGVEWHAGAAGGGVGGENQRQQQQPAPRRLDICECQHLLRCPNGTTAPPGAVDVSSCRATGREVLRRVNAVPRAAANQTWFGRRFDERRTFDPDLGAFTGQDMFLRNHSGFAELAAESSSSNGNDGAASVGTLFLRTFEAAVLTLDLGQLAANLTYNDHYRIAVYVDCKPCPARYQCNYEKEPPACDFPSLEGQRQRELECFAAHRVPACVNASGDACSRGAAAAVIAGEQQTGAACDVHFRRPDLFYCRMIPFYCEDRDLPDVVWGLPMEYCERDPTTGSCLGARQLGYHHALDAEARASGLGGFLTSYRAFGYDCNATRQGISAASAARDLLESSSFVTLDDGTGSAAPRRRQQGCCQCEPHSMPEFFTRPLTDPGFPDNKHTTVQLVMTALRDVELTVCLELLHGAHVAAFVQGVAEATGWGLAAPGNPVRPRSQLFVHSPYRAEYTKPYDGGRLDPSRKKGRLQTSFLAVIKRSDLESRIMLPLNLPWRFVRRPNVLPSTDYAADYTVAFENDVIIDRVAGVTVSDPCAFDFAGEPDSTLEDVCNFAERAAAANAALATQPFIGGGGGNSSDARLRWDDGRGVPVPYPVADSYDLVNECAAGCDQWWEQADLSCELGSAEWILDRPERQNVSEPSTWTAGGDSDFPAHPRRSRVSGWNDQLLGSGATGVDFDFLALPWLPFLSNCDAYDSHVGLARLVETHPRCDHVGYASTRPVAQFFWERGFTLETPRADACWRDPTSEDGDYEALHRVTGHFAARRALFSARHGGR